MTRQENPAAEAVRSSNRFRVEPFPADRNPIVDVLANGKRRHHVHGFSSLDATVVLDRLEQIGKRTGDKPSLTAYIVWRLAHAIAANPEMHAIRRGNQLYLFEDVDVSTIVERETADGRRIPVTLVVRAANRKSFFDVHSQIRDAQRAPLTGISLGQSKEAKAASRFARLPGFLRALVWWWIRRNPVFAKAMIGTVEVTAVGMFGPKGGFAIAPSIWPIQVIVGGLARRPGVVDERIEIRTFLDCTLVIDHEVVDGAPVARFAKDLVEGFESGRGLDGIL